MTLLPAADDVAGWRRLLAGLCLLTAFVYLYLAFFEPGTLRFAPLTIQDDARQFLAWTARIADPAALPGDPLADYWQAVSPPAYRALFRGLSAIGLNPLIAARLIPLGLIGACGALAWRVAGALSATPRAAFIAAAFLLAFLFHEDSIYSATPRAFAPPLFLMLVDALLRRNDAQAVVAIAAAACVYPATAVVGLGMFALSRIRFAPRLRLDLSLGSLLPVALAAVALAVAAGSFAEGTGRWQPVLTLSESRLLPSVSSLGGRNMMVDEAGRYDFVCNARLGFVPEIVACDRHVPGAALVDVLLLLPLLWLSWKALRRRTEEGLAARNRIYLLALVTAVICYSAALLVAFKLHVPSRYSQRPLGPLEWLAIGQTIAALLAGGGPTAPRRAAGSIVMVLLLVSFATPTPGFVRTSDPLLIDRIARLPAAARIGGISETLADVPALAGRAVSASAEHAIPYHLGYFLPLTRRMAASFDAIAAPDQSGFRAARAAGGFDYLLVARALIEGQELHRYATILPSHSRRAQRAIREGSSLLVRQLSRCLLVENSADLLIDAGCVERSGSSPHY